MKKEKNTAVNDRESLLLVFSICFGVRGFCDIFFETLSGSNLEAAGPLGLRL